MRYVAHLVSVVLLVPGIVVAAALLAFGHVAIQPSFPRMVDALLDVLLTFLPALLLVVVAWFALAALGLSRRWHRTAAALVALVAITTSASILWLANVPEAWTEAGIFIPAAIALVIAVCLASTDQAPARRLRDNSAKTRRPPPPTLPRSSGS
jgi:hypothetical protein